MAVDSTGKVKLIDVKGDADVLRALKSKVGNKAAIISTEESNSEQSGAIGKINIDVARAINEQIDPSVLLAERKDKIAKIKEQIAKGEYNVSSEDIAKSFNDEVLQEILLAGDAAKSDSN